MPYDLVCNCTRHYDLGREAERGILWLAASPSAVAAFPLWYANTGIKSRNNGVVANVVTSAMITIIANRVGEMMPRSSPMLSTISSIKPRVFIRTPSAAE